MNRDLSSVGIITGRKKIVTNDVVNAFSILIPVGGTLLGLFFFSACSPTVVTASIFFVFLLNVLGMVIGLYHYFTHR